MGKQRIETRQRGPSPYNPETRASYFVPLKVR